MLSILANRLCVSSSSCCPRCCSDHPNSTTRTTQGVWMECWRPATITWINCNHRRLAAYANGHRYRHVAMLAELREGLDRTYLLFTTTIRLTFDAFRLFDQLRP